MSYIREFRERAVCCEKTENCVFCGYFQEGCDKKNFVLKVFEVINRLEFERDTAVNMLDGECYACTHNSCGEPSREKEVCRTCLNNEDAWWGYELKDNWQWRGVEVDGC